VDANGTIEYEEFLAATLSQHQYEKEENLRAAFAHFDENGDGMISRDELRKALAVSAAACRPVPALVCPKRGPLHRGFGISSQRGFGPYLPYFGPSLVLQGGASQMSDAEIDRIVDDVDKDGDGEIDYEEFCAMLAQRQAVKGTVGKNKTRGNLSAYKAAQSTGLAK
jgi:Ca2+-binding EF-hand superfamily protein